MKSLCGLIIGIICLGLVLGIIFTIAQSCGSSIDIDDYTVQTYVVRSGDTLWSIAECNIRSDDDVRDWIDVVEELNDCDANIKAGQRIKIYTAK